MALTDLTRISTAGIATGSTIDSPILRKDVDFRGDQVGVGSALFDSSERELNLKDNVKLTFGDATNGDLRLYHDGNSNIQDAGTGQLRFFSNDYVLFNAAGNENLLRVTENTGVSLYDGANTVRLATNGSGAIVTGVLTATTFSGKITGDSTGNVTGNIYAASGISTVYNLRVSNDLTVEGTTTTLDTNLIGVDRVEVGANSNSIVGVAITQSGTADILRLYDGASQVLTVDDEGNVGLGATYIPSCPFDIEGRMKSTQYQLKKAGNAASIGAFLHLTNQAGDASENDVTLTANHSTNSVVLRAAAEVQLWTYRNGQYNERLTVVNTGDVGIGTQIPAAKFVVSNDGANGFEFNPNFNSNNSIIASYNRSGGGSYSQLTLSASQHIFAQGGTEYGRFNANGRLGIGTEGPETILTIAKNATNQTVATIPTVRLTNLDTTAVATDIVGSYEFFSKDVHSLNKVTGFMRNIPTDAGVNYDLTFGTIKTSDSNAVERLRITSGGQLELRKNQDGVTGRPTNRIVFKDTDSSVAANQPIGEISWYSTDAGMVNVNSWIRGINEATNGSGALLFGVKESGETEIEALRINSDGKIGIATDTGSGLINTRHAGTNQQVLHVKADLGSTNGRSINLYTPDTDNSTAPFRFQTGNGYIFQCDSEDVLTINHNRLVGIGTDNPTYKLHVDSGDAAIGLWKSRRSSGSYIDYSVGANGAQLGFIGAGGQIIASGADAADFAIRSEGDLCFASGGGTERARIDSSGSMVVGATASGGWKFKVQVAANASYQSAVNITNGVNADLQFEIKNSESRFGPSTETPLVFKTHHTERLRINSAGKVLVGSGCTDASLLNVKGSAGFADNGTNAGIIIDTDGVSGASISCLTTGGFQNGSYSNMRLNALSHKFTYGNTVRMLIKSDGNIGIGTDNPASKLHAYAENRYIQTLESQTGITAGTTSGTIYKQQYTTTGGSTRRMGFFGIKRTHGTGDQRANFVMELCPDNSTNVNLASPNANTTAFEFKPNGAIWVKSGGGIDFSETDDGAGSSSMSELFDDYEEGLFTPTMGSHSTKTSTTGIDTSHDGVGWYVKVGRLVTVNVTFGALHTNARNHVLRYITGLPFTSYSTNLSTAAIGYQRGLHFQYSTSGETTNMHHLYGHIGNSTTQLSLNASKGSSPYSGWPATHDSASSQYLRITISYYAT